MKKEINISLGEGYKVAIEKEILSSPCIADFCSRLGSRVVIITDKKVAKNYSRLLLKNLKEKNIKTDILTFTATEKNKSRRIKEKLEDQMLALNCGRDTCVIALGGGITTDVAGFVAATYYRGIPVVYVPTTLLAMVDASIGGKTGINTSEGKNLIGAFYQPKAVFIDSMTLHTLPKNEFKNGLVEMIKHAIIADKNYFDDLGSGGDLDKLIMTSCVIKKHVVEQDECDKGIRQILNFGHTIGHALEQVSQYQISHGEAVALGIVAESYMSFRQGFLPEDNFLKIKSIFKKYQIPVRLKKKYEKEKIKQALFMDKKNVNSDSRFVIIKDIGQVRAEKNHYTFAVTNEILDQGISLIC